MVRQGSGDIRTHSVEYQIGGGSVAAPDQTAVQEGHSFVVKGYGGTKTGFTFGGWSWNGTTYREGNTIVMGTSDIILKAVWTPKMHGVTYDVTGGSSAAPSTISIQEGSSFTLSSYDGTKEGFTFGGWSYNGITYPVGHSLVMGASDIVLIAVWNTSPTYVITLDANGGSCSATGIMTGTDGRVLSLPTPTYEYHDFDGWFTSASGGERVTESTVFTGNGTLYAHWTAQPGFTIVFDADGGGCDVSKARTGADGRLSSLPVAEREGSIFMGWFTSQSGGEIVALSTVFSEDTTIYARWESEHLITFNANGGQCDTGTATTSGGKVSSLPTPTYTYHDFDGWFTSASGGEEVTVSTVFTEDTTVYAHWKEQPGHTVRFDAGRGIQSVSEMRTDADGKLAYLPEPSLDLYDFEGWFTSQTGGLEVTASTVFDRDTTVYGHWSSSTVSYDHSLLIEATGDPECTTGLSTGFGLTDGAAYQQLPDTAGYRHIGWEVGGQKVGATAPVVDEGSHVAKSLWEKVQEPEPEHGSGDGGSDSSVMTISMACGVAAAVAVLAAVGALVLIRMKR